MPFGLYEVSGDTYSLVCCLSIDDIVVGPALAKGFLTLHSRVRTGSSG